LNTCYDVKNTCGSITTNGDVCKTEGAVIETNENILKCLWLKEKTTKDVVRNKVYSNDF
jgi:hypothetical protein